SAAEELLVRIAKAPGLVGPLALGNYGAGVCRPARAVTMVPASVGPASGRCLSRWGSASRFRSRAAAWDSHLRGRPAFQVAGWWLRELRPAVFRAWAQAFQLAAWSPLWC